MKKLTLLAVATTMMLSSCMDKAEIQRLERKRFVQDSVQHRIDSLKTTDMHLSFMGIVIGESAPDFGGFNISEGVTHLKPR